MKYVIKNPCTRSLSTFRNVFDELENTLSNSWQWSDYSTSFSDYKFKSEVLDTEVVITGTVPGFDKKDISIEVEDNLLIIKGDLSKGDDDGDLIKAGTFEKRYSLLEDMDVEAAVASCENGMLVLTIPRIVPEKINKIIKIK